MATSKRCVFLLFALLFLAYCSDVNAGRVSSGNNRRSGGGSTRRQPSSNTGHVTKPSYNTNSGTYNHNDMTKLSYPSNNAQPNHVSNTGSQSGQPIGWNIPKQQGPPPAYSASNPIGGAKTNVHEQPPAYRPNNAPPPNYGANNVHTPITATNAHSVQSGYPQQQHGGNYNPAGQVPAGATYYPGGHAPAGATYYPAGHAPAGATYYPGGHAPVGAGYPAGHMPAGGAYYPQSAGVPQGATYLPAGSSLPAGATYYASPPQSSSSGLGFGSGLAAGALGGALLGHVLTPQTKVIEQAPAANGHSGGEDKVIVINNGPPGSVQTTQAGGATVITTNTQQTGQPAADTNAAPPVAVATGAAAATVPLAAMGALPTNENSTTNAPATAPIPAAGAEQPPPGGIICVPMKVNETDPNDETKMVEVEKIACYPAPPPQPDASAPQPGPVAPQPAPVTQENNSGAPLAPMNPVPGQTSQQLQQNSGSQITAMHAGNSAVTFFDFKCGYIMLSSMLGLFLSYSFN